MTLQPELSLRWNCNPRLFGSYFIPVFKENNFHSKGQLGMFTLDSWSVLEINFKCSGQCLNRSRYIWLAILSYHGNLKPVSDIVNPRAKWRSCWSQGTHPIKTWETKVQVLIYRLAVGGGRLGDFGRVTLLDAFPPYKVLYGLIPRPFTVYRTGSFFLSWRSFTVPLFTRIKVIVCVLGLGAERAYSSALSSLGKFRKSPQRKLLERITWIIWTEKKQVYNQTQTSGDIFGLHREEK